MLALLASCRREPASTPPAAEPVAHGSSPSPEAAPLPATTTSPPAKDVVTRPVGEDALWIRLGVSDDDGNRTVIGRYGTVRITAEGEPFATAGGAPAFDDAEVIETQGDRVRVVTRGQSGWSQLALWIDTTDAALQLSRPATLLPDPTHTTRPEDGTIELAPGERIDILEQGPTHTKVRTHDGEYSGWVELDRLAPVFVDAPFELPRFDAETKPRVLVARTPGGKPFFTMPDLANGMHMVRTL